MKSDFVELMKRSLNLFIRMFAKEICHLYSYKIVHKIEERGKPFTGGNFIKECMMKRKLTCVPRKPFFGKYQPFSKFSCAENIVLQIHIKLQENKFLKEKRREGKLVEFYRC